MSHKKILLVEDEAPYSRCPEEGPREVRVCGRNRSLRKKKAIEDGPFHPGHRPHPHGHQPREGEDGRHGGRGGHPQGPRHSRPLPVQLHTARDRRENRKDHLLRLCRQGFWRDRPQRIDKDGVQTLRGAPEGHAECGTVPRRHQYRRSTASGSSIRKAASWTSTRLTAR